MVELPKMCIRDSFEHNGINIKALTRAALINIRHLSIVQGGSTITQQLSKTVYLSLSLIHIC